jgi:hypothetical protein
MAGWCGPWPERRVFVAGLALGVLAVAVAAVGQGAWRTAAPLPSSRTEVTGTALEGRIYVIGGF